MREDWSDKKVVCKKCLHEDIARNFQPSMDCYHDMRCPKCGTTHLDTSDLGADPQYGFGNDNFLRQEVK